MSRHYIPRGNAAVDRVQRESVIDLEGVPQIPHHVHRTIQAGKEPSLEEQIAAKREINAAKLEIRRRLGNRKTGLRPAAVGKRSVVKEEDRSHGLSDYQFDDED